MFLTDFSRVDVITKTIRSIFSVIDGVAYGLLALLYKLFYAVATSEIFKAATISQIYSRIQLIIGVFMVFELTMSVIKGIVNPDTFTDSKSGGSTLLIRVAIALVMLAMLVPISIPSPNNEYEKQVNNNGILFGTLYSLQNRVLSNNTLGRLILGTDDEGINYTNLDEEGSQKLDSSSRMFATSVLKAFYRVNAREDTNPPESVCSSIRPGIMELYEVEDQDPLVITGMVNETCDTMGINIGKIWYVLTGDGGGVAYVFSYTPLLPLIVAIILDVVMIIYIIEVAKRAIKLAILRLIAPIPIISYIDTKGGKDNSLSTWTKSLIETYISLFIRIAIMYFIMFLIQNLLTNGISISITDSWTGAIIAPLTIVFIIIGLFLFAKDAPKFIRKALGIKDPEGGFFGDIGKVLGAGVAVAGAVGSFNASRSARMVADKEFAKSQNWSQAETDAYLRRNRGKYLMSGVLGAGHGLLKGSAAASSDKGNVLSKVFAAKGAMDKRNTDVKKYGRMGGTLFGSLGSEAHELFTGESRYDQNEAKRAAAEQKIKDEELVLKTKQDANAHRKGAMDRAKSKAIDSDKTLGQYKGVWGNYRSFHSAYEAAVNSGVGLHTQYVDASGKRKLTKTEYQGLSAEEQELYTEKSWFTFDSVDDKGIVHHQTIDMAQANDIDIGLKDANTASFYENVVLYERYSNEKEKNIKNGMSEADAIREAKITAYMEQENITRSEAEAQIASIREYKITECMIQNNIKERSEAEAIVDAKPDIGINDLSILADRQAYRDASNGENMEAKFDGATGLKAQFGVKANENSAESDRLNREREKINTERQGYEAQRDKADSSRLKNGGK